VAPDKGKQARVVLDDDEISSDEDERLQKWLWQLSSTGPAMLDEAAVMTTVADKEAAAKRAAEQRVVEEVAAKAVAVEDVVGKTTDEAARAAGGSPAPSQATSVAGVKRAAAPSGSTPPAKRPYRGVWKPQFV
jgi:hypothetical protein